MLVLASSSPQRRALLEQAGYRFRVVVPSPEAESGAPNDLTPDELVRFLAERKAADVARRLQVDDSRSGTGVSPDWSGPQHWQDASGTQASGGSNPGDVSPDEIIVACDTVAHYAGHILGKPADQQDARRMLQLLRGQVHEVLSGLCVWPVRTGLPRVEVALTRLLMEPLTDAQIDEYLASGQWQDKAGGFGLQDRIGWLRIVEGSASNVIGLPVELLAQMLNDAAKAPK